MEFTARIPADLAAELQADGLARPIPQVRSSGPLLADLILAFNSSVSVVTLLGTPIGTKSISERIVSWLGRQKAESGARLTLSARGRHGRVELEIDDSTTAPEIASLISDIVKALDTK